MKKGFLSLIILFSFTTYAQKGIELRIQSGYAFLGIDPWTNHTLLSFSGLYNINGVLAIGPTYNLALSPKLNIDNKSNSYAMTLSEIGLLSQVTFLRTGKLKAYGSISISQISGDAGTINDPFFNNGNSIVLNDSGMAIGFGGGLLLNLGSGLYFNIIDLRVASVGTDFLDLNKGEHGVIGAYSSIKTGISFALQSK